MVSDGGNWSVIEHKLYLPSEPNIVLLISRDVKSGKLVMRHRSITYTFCTRTSHIARNIPVRRINSWKDYEHISVLAEDLKPGDEYLYSVSRKKRWAVVASVNSSSPSHVSVTSTLCRRDTKGGMTIRTHPNNLEVRVRKLK